MFTRFSRPLFAATTALAAAALPAQASFTTFGSSCVQGMAIGSIGLPRLGQTMQITYAGPAGNQFIGFFTNIHQPVLLLGLSNTQAGAVQLPFVLPLNITNGGVCELLVSPDSQRLVPLWPSAPPPLQLPLTIPNNTNLLGLRLHAQWMMLSERSLYTQILWRTLHTSNAATLVIGV